jgi:hypothetical protein
MSVAVSYWPHTGYLSLVSLNPYTGFLVPVLQHTTPFLSFPVPKANFLFSGEITNKMQPCNRIYCSTVHWRLNMFLAAHRSSSEPAFPLRLDYGRSPHAYVNQRLQIQLELLMMSGVPLETCWAFNERWNNKFFYKVASCWLFFLSHTTMHGSMNINFLL